VNGSPPSCAGMKNSEKRRKRKTERSGRSSSSSRRSVWGVRQTPMGDPVVLTHHRALRWWQVGLVLARPEQNERTRPPWAANRVVAIVEVAARGLGRPRHLARQLGVHGPGPIARQFSGRLEANDVTPQGGNSVGRRVLVRRRRLVGDGAEHCKNLATWSLLLLLLVSTVLYRGETANDACSTAVRKPPVSSSGPHHPAEPSTRVPWY
jgi:hypothetical protein